MDRLPTHEQVTLDAFVAWLDRQPEIINMSHCNYARNCVMGQFLNAVLDGSKWGCDVEDYGQGGSNTAYVMPAWGGAVIRYVDNWANRVERRQAVRREGVRRHLIAKGFLPAPPEAA